MHDTKRAVADGILGSEIRRIAREVGDADDALVDALAELAACFPVYRSYLPDGRTYLDAAFAEARRQRPDLVAGFDALAPVLGDPTQAAAQRFQQTTGAVMAKGVEDCAFYRTSRLTSLTEVGGDPAEWSCSVEEFHAAMTERQASRRHAMTTTSTHDTKRGEDVRARIAVLAELPEVWADAVDALLTAVAPPGPVVRQPPLAGGPRLLAGLARAATRVRREGDAGGRRPDHLDGPRRGVRAGRPRRRGRGVRRPFGQRGARGRARAGRRPGLEQRLAAKAIALTMPGVPDIYQGSELWEQSLVDPDNRRLVDLEVRREVLDRVLSGERPVLTPHLHDPGHAKLLVTQAALTLRRNQPHRFTTYAPVEAAGPAAGHVVAFDRGGALTIATRLPVRLAVHGWGDTVLALPDGEWADLLTGREYAGDAPSARAADRLPGRAADPGADMTRPPFSVWAPTDTGCGWSWTATVAV